MNYPEVKTVEVIHLSYFDQKYPSLGLLKDFRVYYLASVQTPADIADSYANYLWDNDIPRPEEFAALQADLDEAKAQGLWIDCRINE